MVWDVEAAAWVGLSIIGIVAVAISGALVAKRCDMDELMLVSLRHDGVGVIGMVATAAAVALVRIASLMLG